MDASTHGTVVEYAVRECFKHRTPATAARITREKLGGSANLFIGGGTEVIDIDEEKLEMAIWDRIREACLYSLKYIKPGFEHVAIAGTLEQFGQKATKQNLVRLTALVTNQPR